MIGVFVVAASARVRHDLKLRLDKDGIRVVGTAANVEAAEDEIEEKDADVLLVSTKGASSEEIFRALEETRLTRETPVMVLLDPDSLTSSPNFTQRAVKMGTRGILNGDVGASELQSAVTAVANGLVVLSLVEAEALGSIRETSAETADSIEALTPREREVLQRMAAGLANKEIALRMGISEHTVKFHVASILGKLGCASRTEAVSVGMRRGLILL